MSTGPVPVQWHSLLQTTINTAVLYCHADIYISCSAGPSVILRLSYSECCKTICTIVLHDEAEPVNILFN